MKAWMFRRYGGPEVPEWAELPEPVPRKDEIVVRVVAAARNPPDWKPRAGKLRFMAVHRLPRGVGSCAVQLDRDIASVMVARTATEGRFQADAAYPDVSRRRISVPGAQT